MIGIVGGCEGDGDGNGNESDASVDFPIQLRGSCAPTDHIGTFTVFASSAVSGVRGEVLNGVLPINVRDVVMEVGDCKLLRPPTLFCDPSCMAAQTCDASGACIDRPTRQDVGRVTITGLTEAIEMEPRANNDYGAIASTNPVFASSAEIRLLTTDDASTNESPLQLGGYGFNPLVLPSLDLLIKPGQTLELSWTANGSASVDSRIGLNILINQHGTSRTRLVCDFPDTGSGQVAASLIDKWIAEGVSGFPNGSMARRTTDKASISAGCVEFVVEHQVSNKLSVDGFTPCKKNDDCPVGQTCDIPNEICIDL